jgi:hypothetical protein
MYSIADKVFYRGQKQALVELLSLDCQNSITCAIALMQVDEAL